MSSTSQHSSGVSPRFIFTVVIPVALLGFIAYEIYVWMSQHGGGLWIVGFVTVIGLVGLTWTIWRVRKVLADHQYEKDVRALEVKRLAQQARIEEHRAALLEEEAYTRKTSRQLMEESLLYMREARAKGLNINMEYANDGTVKRMQAIASRVSKQVIEEIEGPDQDVPQIEAPLPTNVRYEDIRGQVPKGHVLVGMGRAGVETRDAAVGACTWIVGLSGTGKTSTTVTRVEERDAIGHSFLGCDPHWFKPDSLTNAVTAYEKSFLMPMAKTPEEMKAVLTAFLEEFRGRKAGTIPQPWKPITLIVDEVGSLMDTTNAEEEEIAKMLPSIARICGQEARNFLMGGIFISQQATGLSWLRKVALMIIVHQLLMESEKKLALQGDKEAIESMKSWPVGRTYVYGVGFQDGPRTVQQPYFAKVVDSTARPVMEDLPMKSDQPLARVKSEPLDVSILTPSQDRLLESFPFVETASDLLADILDGDTGNADDPSVEKNTPPVSTEKLETISRMKKADYPDREIAKLVGLAGRKYGLYQASIAYLESK